MLFETLAQNLTDKDYGIHSNALKEGVSQELNDLRNNIPPAFCHSESVGRSDNFHVDRSMGYVKMKFLGLVMFHLPESRRIALLYRCLFSIESHSPTTQIAVFIAISGCLSGPNQSDTVTCQIPK